MTESHTNMCRICLTTNRDDNISDSSCFAKFFIHVMSFKDFNQNLWLCLWCKASVKKANALFTLALESERAWNNECTTKVLEDSKSIYRLSYVQNVHIDIQPEVKQDNELKTTLTDTNTHNITEETREITNCVHEIENEFEIERKQNHNELKLIENSTKELMGTSKLNDDSIIENEVEMRSNKKQLNFNELKFEVEYLNLEEQLKEVEMKKVKYKQFQFHCNDCGLGFLTGDIFEEHKIRHTEVSGPHVCNICFLHFKSQDVLSQHMLAHRRRFKCLLCAAIFKRWAHCIAHRYRCGGIVELTACGVCQKIFSNEHSLKVHMKTHRTEKKYPCGQCDRRFATKQHLTVHMRSHSGIKPFACSHCDRSFATSSSLRAHCAVHSESNQYYCVECNTSYKTAKSLKRHFNESARHKISDSVMYFCKECSKQFSSKNSLKHHINALHGSEHRCSQCNKTFSKSSNLNKHIKCVHTTK